MVRHTTPLVPRLGAALAAVLVVGSLQAEAPRKKVVTLQPGVYQMELLNGASRTVRTVGVGLSTSEMASLSDVDRLENEAAFAQDVQALKRQYVLSERLLEPYRRVVQQELYGRTVTQNNYANATFGGGYGAGYYGYPYYGVGGFGFNRLGGYSTASLGGQTTEVRSLANGVGDEGPLKAALAGVIAQQAGSGYAAAVAHDYDRAVTTATFSPRLRAGLRLRTPEETRRDNEAIRAVDYEAPVANRVTLTLKDGKKVVGTNLVESKEWVTIERADGGKSRYRLSQVQQIDEPKNTGKNKPAVDD